MTKRRLVVVVALSTALALAGVSCQHGLIDSGFKTHDVSDEPEYLTHYRPGDRYALVEPGQVEEVADWNGGGLYLAYRRPLKPGHHAVRGVAPAGTIVEVVRVGRSFTPEVAEYHVGPRARFVTGPFAGRDVGLDGLAEVPGPPAKFGRRLVFHTFPPERSTPVRRRGETP